MFLAVSLRVSPFTEDDMLDEKLAHEDEALIQQLWKTYCKAICIKERLNPRKHRQDMPVRYWKYLTEKQQKTRQR